MRLIFIIALVAIWGGTARAEPLVLSGAIGPYDIDVELTRVEDELVGRYRYTGRDTWLSLTGEVFGQEAVRLTEEVDGVHTGTFFLAVAEDEFRGYWASEDASFEAQMSAADVTVMDLMDPVNEEDVNSSVTGRYHTGRYWINDMWAPNYEVGFNGGSVNVVEVSHDLIYARFDFIVGPTYHFATFQGFARRTEGQTFVHDATLDGGSENCRLVFTFGNGALSIEDIDNGFACHFGARAHANFNLSKVSNVAEFEEFR